MIINSSYICLVDNSTCTMLGFQLISKCKMLGFHNSTTRHSHTANARFPLIESVDISWYMRTCIYTIHLDGKCLDVVHLDTIASLFRYLSRYKIYNFNIFRYLQCKKNVKFKCRICISKFRRPKYTYKNKLYQLLYLSYNILNKKIMLYSQNQKIKNFTKTSKLSFLVKT